MGTSRTRSTNCTDSGESGDEKMVVSDFSWNTLYFSFRIHIKREKGRDLTQSYDKSPTPTRKNPTRQHKKRHQNFDYTTIADRLIKI